MPQIKNLDEPTKWEKKKRKKRIHWFAEDAAKFWKLYEIHGKDFGTISKILKSKTE